MCLSGVVLLLLYALYASRVELPVLDLRLLRIPSFHASVVGGSLFRIGLGAVPFLLPLALQEGLGMTAFKSGSITCASAFGAIFMKTAAIAHSRRFGFRTVLMFNAACAGLAIAVLRAVLSRHAALADLVCRVVRRLLSVVAVHVAELAGVCGYSEPRSRPRDECRERDPADFAWDSA